MQRVLAELPATLVQHNRDQRDSRRFQLRLAVNVGPVSGDVGGISGEAVDIAASLLEAPDFKQAMADRARGPTWASSSHRSSMRPWSARTGT
jgi:hypothetical protein